MKILGINISHDCSSCLLEDGKVIYFMEDERINRIKHYNISSDGRSQLEDGSFEPCFLDKLKIYTNYVDYIVFSSYGRENMDDLSDNDEAIIELYLQSFEKYGIKYGEYVFNSDEHHIHHAANAFYGSGFEDAICLIMDGGGSIYPNQSVVEDFLGSIKNLDGGKNIFREMESFFEFSYDHPPKKLNQLWGYLRTCPEIADVDDVGPVLQSDEFVYKHGDDILTNTLSNGQLFNGISHIIGLNDGADAGKVMGLSSYSTNLIGPYEFEKIDWFKEVDSEWITSKEIRSFIFDQDHAYDINSFEGMDFYIKANLCKKLQDETLKHTNRLIEKALRLSNSRNIVISGGYALNCLNNYKYLDNLPDDVKIYIDPISNDAGTSLGAAKLLWYKLSGSKVKNKLNSLYLG